jgi:hypothetical protein
MAYSGHKLIFTSLPSYQNVINKYGENVLTIGLLGSSSTESDSVGSPFDVLVSVDLASAVTDTKRTFKCSATSTTNEGQAAIDSILSQIESVTTLDLWTSGLEGILYEGAGSNATSYAARNLEQYLNTMTMVQGGGNSVQSLPSDSILYGCIKDKTKISLGVVALVFFTAFILIVIFLYWIILLLIISKHALFRVAKRNHGLKNIKPVPDGIISWMLQAAREQAQGPGSTPEGIPKREEDLRDWDFTIVDPTQGVARMVRARGEVVMMTPQLVQAYPKNGPY